VVSPSRSGVQREASGRVWRPSEQGRGSHLCARRAGDRRHDRRQSEVAGVDTWRGGGGKRSATLSGLRRAAQTRAGR